MASPSATTTRWTTVLIAWGLLALVFLPQAWMLNLSRPEPWPFWLAATRNAAIFLIWAALTPIALRAVRRWPPFGLRRWRNAARLLGVALVLCALHLAAMALVSIAMAGGPVPVGRLSMSLAVGLGATNLLMAAGLFAVGIAQVQLEARRAAERQLAEARLAALRHQLQPHFLFNTLNALAELVHSDADRAETLLLRLSALLRRALEEGQARRITLREELDFLDDYLEIQHALLGDRLRIERHIAADALEAMLPPLLLQPLTENALRHGIAPLPAGGTLSISARREAGKLHLVIADDGAGAASPLRDGVGLGNTRERLQTEYRGAARLDIDTSPGAGFRVVLQLPT